MPRIQAATLAQHRQRQRRAILDATRELLVEHGEAPGLGEVGRRAGLARPSVYQYFGSRDELLAALVDELFPAWAEHVLRRVDAAADPAARVRAYVAANIELLTSSEQAVARVIGAIVDPQVLQAPVREFHERVQAPLVAALAEMGEERAADLADVVNAMVLRAAQSAEHTESGRAAALSLLETMLGPYLDAAAPPDGRRRARTP